MDGKDRIMETVEAFSGSHDRGVSRRGHRDALTAREEAIFSEGEG